MNKLLSLLSLFRQGSAVVNPKLWKERQITATVLAGVIVAAVNALAMFGVALPIDPDSANALAAGFIAVVNLVLTLTTSPTVGFPAKPDPSAIAAQAVTAEEKSKVQQAANAPIVFPEIKHQEEYEKYLQQQDHESN